VAGLLMWAARPLFFILGAHPPNPLGGGCAPSTPGLISEDFDAPLAVV